MTAATDAPSLNAPTLDQVALISPIGPSCHLTKVFEARPDGQPTEIPPTYRPKHFTVQLRSISGLKDLLPILQKGDPNTAILRATPTRGGTVSRRAAHWTPDAHHWFLIDIDGIDYPDHIDLTLDPQAAVLYAIDQLSAHWPELARADVAWQLSASAGFKPGLRLHLWFWADRPLSNRRLLHHIKAVNKAAGFDLIDPGIFHRCQLHYTAHPILKGLQDPFPVRAGLIERSGHLDTARIKPPATPPPPDRPKAPTGHSDIKHGANLPYLAAAVRGVLRNTHDDSDGRKQRAYAGAVRLASFYGDPQLAAALRQLGHTDHSLKQDLICAAVAAGLTPNRATIDVERGWNKGLTLQPDSPSLWRRQSPRTQPTTNTSQQVQPQPPPNSDAPLTLIQARAQLDHIVFNLKPRDTYLLAAPPGVGKSTAKFKAALTAQPGELVILVEKDRHAVLTSHDHIPGSVYLLGKSSAGAHTADWQPHHTDDGTDLSSCGNPIALQKARLGGTSHHTCAGCSFADVCTGSAPNGTLGTRGQWHQAKQLLRTGGVLITTSSMFLALLDRYNALTDAARAPITQLWLDDLPSPPGESILTPDRLRQSAQLLIDPDQQTALIDLIERIERYKHTANPGQHGAFADIDTTRQLLTGLNTKALTDATQTDGVPLALKTLARWLDLSEPKAHAFLVCDSEGKPSLEVLAPPPQLPPHTAVLIASATTQAPVWQSWLDRTITTWRPTLHAECNGLWLQSSLFHTKRIALSKPHELIPALHRHNQAIQDRLKDARRVLVCTHKANIDHPHWTHILDHLFVGLDHIERHVIHWRGIDQVGSNQFAGFDAVLSLGDPRLHLGKWDRTRLTIDHWNPGAASLLDYKREAQGWVEQLEGRLRLHQFSNRTLIHIGNTPSPTLLGLQPQPTRADGQSGRPAHALTHAHHWLMDLPIDAAGAALHTLPNAPSSSTLERLIQFDDRPTWSVQLSGRGGNQHWKADTPEQVLHAVQWLLCRGGDGPVRTVVAIIGLDGQTVYSPQTRIEQEKNRGCGEQSSPSPSESSESGSCQAPPPPTEESNDVSPQQKQLDELGVAAKKRLLWLAQGRKGSVSKWTVSAAVGLPTWMLSAKLYKEAAAHLVEHGHEAGQLVGG